MTTNELTTTSQITNEDELQEACRQLTIVKRLWDKHEAERKELKRPSLDSCKVIDQKAKEQQKPLGEKEQKLRTLINGYVTTQRARYVDTICNQAEQLKMSQQEAVRAALQLYKSPETDDVFFTTTWCVDVDDLNAVPDKYIIRAVDVKALLKAHQRGEEVPGVKFISEIRCNVRSEKSDDDQ
jgi:hypothetical protein